MGPVKRSVMIAGHATSISLEPIYWEALCEAAAAERLPLNALVARIDQFRNTVHRARTASTITAPMLAQIATQARVLLAR